MPTQKDATTEDTFLTHILHNVLKKLNVDSSGRLRVSAENSITVGSCASHAVTLSSTSITTLATTSFAGITAASYQQLLAHGDYVTGFRRNLVVS